MPKCKCMSCKGKDWFFKYITRKEAEHLLLSVEYPIGSFLIRPSKNFPECYTLSTKVVSQSDPYNYDVNHYKIEKSDNGGYFLSSNRIFNTLEDLIRTYSRTAHGLNHVLTKPCTSFDENDWEIDQNDLCMLRDLGSGNFGEVKLAAHKYKGEVAVKVFKKTQQMSMVEILEEAAIMKTLRHRHLVKLIGVCSHDESIYIVLEYMENGSLLSFLKEGDGRAYNYEKLMKIAYDISSGMKYLESKKIVHRDLAARNILMDENNRAKIGDFGLARVIGDSEFANGELYKSYTGICPIKWTAPEALFNKMFTIKSDVWSFGILLMEILTYGREPYKGISIDKLTNMLRENYRMPNPKKYYVPDNVYKLMLECWDKNPDKRPFFYDLNFYLKRFKAKKSHNRRCGCYGQDGS
ncbi:unnamed protein product [Phyllotreta striolata]|uniref:Tyrosine-protein kinase n=1 Tax=Phyllotreta striolata TaxID=444603 RepID=A0A9P0GQZ8_PHYSR|nr:unnamed protein product [Phyllotreta striolata]